MARGCHTRSNFGETRHGSKIGNFGPDSAIALREEHICRLDVSMNQKRRVKLAQPVKNADGRSYCFHHREWAKVKPRQDASAFNEFHRNKNVFLPKALRIVYSYEIAFASIDQGRFN
jgi:hypothetical protein